MSFGRVKRVIEAGRRSDKAQIVPVFRLFRRIPAKRLASMGQQG
jgi:hypothetical protein